MNWHDVLPEAVAVEQIAFERRERVLRMHQSGMMQKNIAADMNVSPSIISAMVRKALQHRAEGKLPPAVRWCERWLPDMLPGLEAAAQRKSLREAHWSYKPPPRYTFEPWP